MNFSQNIFIPNQKQHKDFHDLFRIKNKPGSLEKRLYKKLYHYIKYIQWIPGIRMIGVGNSLAMNCVQKNSDIDLYIVTAPNRMWFVRIIVTCIFQILGVRKTPMQHAERFCLSFFSTTNSLDFSSFSIQNDIYLYFWVLYFKPIVNINDCYAQFLEANTSWADFSKYPEIIKQNNSYIQYSQNTAEKHTFSPFGNIFDHFLKKIFLPKTLQHYKKIGKPYGIIINDNMLKFHNGDVRKDISKKI